MSTKAYPQSLASVNLDLWGVILLTTQFPLLPLGGGVSLLGVLCLHRPQPCWYSLVIRTPALYWIYPSPDGAWCLPHGGRERNKRMYVMHLAQ